MKQKSATIIWENDSAIIGVKLNCLTLQKEGFEKAREISDRNLLVQEEAENASEVGDAKLLQNSRHERREGFKQ